MSPWSERPQYKTALVEEQPYEIGTYRAMVLGGTSGIGKAVARQLQQMGVETCALGREDFFIADSNKLHKAIEDYRPTHLVYSVGVNALDWLEGIFYPTFRDIMETNVWGFIDTLQALGNLYEGEADKVGVVRPSIVAISSDAARRPMRTSAVYCASKAALDAVVRVAARERASIGWRVNAVSPGKVADTKMTEYVDARVQMLRGWTAEQADAYEHSSNALGRPATVDEVAQVVLDVLFGPPSLNGAIIEVNGGR